METVDMLIRLKQPITRKMLANRLNIRYHTLKRKMEEVPGLRIKERDLLTSDVVTIFFQHYQFSPSILDDVATVYEKDR